MKFQQPKGSPNAENKASIKIKQLQTLQTIDPDQGSSSNSMITEAITEKTKTKQSIKESISPTQTRESFKNLRQSINKNLKSSIQSPKNIRNSNKMRQSQHS